MDIVVIGTLVLSIDEPKLGVCGEQFIEGIETQDMEFIEYEGVMGDMAVADEDIADEAASEYIFCESIMPMVVIDRGVRCRLVFTWLSSSSVALYHCLHHGPRPQTS